MNKKLFKQILETYFLENQINFEVKDDKINNFLFFRLFPNLVCNHISKGISIEVYKNYIILNMFGWELIEKFTNIEKIKNFNILQVLNFFIHKELKFKFFFSSGIPYKYQIYIMKNYSWKLYFKTRLFLTNPFRLKKIKEFDIDSLIKVEETTLTNQSINSSQ